MAALFVSAGTLGAIRAPGPSIALLRIAVLRRSFGCESSAQACAERMASPAAARPKPWDRVWRSLFHARLLCLYGVHGLGRRPQRLYRPCRSWVQVLAASHRGQRIGTWWTFRDNGLRGPGGEKSSRVISDRRPALTHRAASEYPAALFLSRRRRCFSLVIGLVVFRAVHRRHWHGVRCIRAALCALT